VLDSIEKEDMPRPIEGLPGRALSLSPSLLEALLWLAGEEGLSLSSSTDRKSSLSSLKSKMLIVPLLRLSCTCSRKSLRSSTVMVSALEMIGTIGAIIDISLKKAVSIKRSR
jgi:hypothetical protein